VYGLAANAFDARAVARIFEVKGRPPENPIIVHVNSLAMAQSCVAAWPEQARRLAKTFWPGPLTLVLPKSTAIPPIVTAGGNTVGIRWPAHPFMRELIRLCGFPLAAPSANLSNQVSPTSAEHVLGGLHGKIPLVIDAGQSNVGIESTVVDLTVSPPRVLRPGMISSDQIATALSTPIATGTTPASSGLKSPGLLQKHYSPRARLRIARWSSETDLERFVKQLGIEPGGIHVLAHEHIPERLPFGRVAVIPQDSEAYARALYGELHRSDELAATLILVEEPPGGPAWEGIRDRLRRASADG
jgi:L-threonylcarbamoyladenylate synthase